MKLSIATSPSRCCPSITRPVWLAYKEANALIQFDAAPTTPATPDGK